MAISETASRNHEELFPGHTSKLAVTDPELIEVFDKAAFDEVLQHGKLDARTRLMVQLVSMIACQALREYRVMLGAALIVGVTPVEVTFKERLKTGLLSRSHSPHLLEADQP